MITPELIVALTIYFEAGGESAYGRLCVASVLYNRATRDQVPPAHVALEYRQFECWNTRSPETTMLTEPETQSEAWKECRVLAVALSLGRFKPVDNWTHFYNPKVSTPPWAPELRNTCIVGKHRFGRIGP